MIFSVWIIAAITVFLISLIVAIVSVEREKKADAELEDLPDRGDATLLSKPVESPVLGHGQVREQITPQDSVEMLDDTKHTHTEITSDQPVVEQMLPEIQKTQNLGKVDEDVDEIIPRYLEEEMNDKEQSRKLAGEIDL